MRLDASNADPIPEWLLTMPKVELHVHLEGTMTPATLWHLVQLHDRDIGIASVEDAEALFRYRDFPHFIETFTTCSDCLRAASDLALLVSEYGAELARQNVRYAEIHFNPEPHHRRKGIPFADQLRAINEARSRVADEHGVELRWIVDGVRDAIPGPTAADRALGWMIEAGPESGIVALGLGGNEIDHPPAPFSRTFARARGAGFHLVAHAGEARGPESIRETLDYLEVERIGHGIAAAHDPDLMNDLSTRGIPLEIAPTSNVCTGVVRSVDDIPFKTFIEHGVEFSINSDDPPMFGTTLVYEYAKVVLALGMSRQDVAALVGRSIEHSFADDATKSRLKRELRAHTPYN